MPAVSVVLPVRDAAETLDRAIESVLLSQRVSVELICVDDGSSDETPRLLRHWAARDARLRVARTPARGIVDALNTGLEMARAPLVARMDADDEIHPDRLAAQEQFLHEQPDLVLAGCQVATFRDGGLGEGYRIYTDWVNALCSPAEIARAAFIECPIPHPTWMFRRDSILELGGYRDRAWPEDLDLFYRLLVAGRQVGKLARVLHSWRDHPGRLSRTDPRYAREAFARAKAHFVARIHPMSGAVVWGAGKTGRRFVRLLEAEGVATRALVDIHPSRIGTSWRGIPILAPASLRERASGWRAEGLRVLGAVASRGAREEIRRELRSLRLREGDDFLMVA